MTVAILMIIMHSDTGYIFSLQGSTGNRERTEERIEANVLLKQNERGHSWCLIYDKPPRTGSTTVSRSLRECWKSIPGFVIRNRKNLATDTISDFLTPPYYKFAALVGSHFFMTPTDVSNLRSKCLRTVYITSTRTMSERLWSEAKHIASHAYHLSNSSITSKDLPQAWTIVNEKLAQSELYFEKYPFVTSFSNFGTFSKNTVKILSPAYIIRTEHLSEDVFQLFKAFRCGEQNYKVMNMHTMKLPEVDQDTRSTNSNVFQNVPKNLSDIPLKFGDYRHSHLLNLAKKINSEGLAIAEQIRNDANVL